MPIFGTSGSGAGTTQQAGNPGDPALFDFTGPSGYVTVGLIVVVIVLAAVIVSKKGNHGTGNKY